MSVENFKRGSHYFILYISIILVCFFAGCKHQVKPDRELRVPEAHTIDVDAAKASWEKIRMKDIRNPETVDDLIDIGYQLSYGNWPKDFDDKLTHAVQVSDSIGYQAGTKEALYLMARDNPRGKRFPEYAGRLLEILDDPAKRKWILVQRAVRHISDSEPDKALELYKKSIGYP